MQQDQMIRNEYHKWDKEFCTDAAPSYWECWQAAWAIMQKRVIVLESELKATQSRLDTCDKLLREEFAQRQDVLAALRTINHISKED